MRDGKLHPRTPNLTGRKSHYLTVLRPGDSNGLKRRWWVRCVCGKTYQMVGAEITKGRVKSCGCKGRELIGDAQRTHGMSKTRPYRIWRFMMARCYRESHHAWDLYGGRGVFVCERWHDFKTFWKDVRQGYESTLTLDRIDPDGPYCSGNVRWATMQEQAKNRRNSLPVSLKSLSRETGIPKSTLYYRWSHDLSMTSSKPDPGKDTWLPAKKAQS